MAREMQLFSIYDSVGERYFPPFTAENAKDALRSFGDILRDPQSALSRHVDDYILFRMGKYVVETGRITPLEQPELIETGAALFTPTEVPQLRAEG